MWVGRKKELLQVCRPVQGCLERRRVMSAMETITGGERAVEFGFFGERTQEFDKAVSRKLPMFYKRAFLFLGNRQDVEDAVQDALLCACKHLGNFREQPQTSNWRTASLINAAC